MGSSNRTCVFLRIFSISACLCLCWHHSLLGASFQQKADAKPASEVSAPQSDSDSKAGDPTINKLVARAVLSRGPFSVENYRTKLVLEDIEPNKSYLVSLSLVNPFEKDIPFRSMVGTCGCTSAKYGSHVLAAENSFPMEVSFKVPNGDMSGVFRTVLNFHTGENPKFDSQEIISVEIECQLKGNLAIDKTNGLFYCGPEVTTWRIPVAVSDPIDKQSLEIVKSEALRDLVAKLVQYESGLQLEFSAVPVIIGEHGLSGSLTVRVPGSDRSASLDLIVYRKEPVSVAPNFIRFQPDTEESEVLVANAIFKVEANVNSSGTGDAQGVNNQTTESSTKIEGDANANRQLRQSPTVLAIPVLERLECRCGDELLRLESTKLNDGVFRIRILGNRSQLSGKDLTWTAVVGGKTHSVVTLFAN